MLQASCPVHQSILLTDPSTVEEIDYIVHEKNVSDNFMGLILVPLVEKFAEHLTAIDEAYDNQVQFSPINHPFTSRLTPPR